MRSQTPAPSASVSGSAGASAGGRSDRPPRGRRPTRGRAAIAAASVAAIALAATGLSACGSSENDAAIVVAGSPISKATIAHWIPIEAVVSVHTIPVRPQPKGLIPDPPNFTACIAWLRTPVEQLNPAAPKNPTPAQLKAGCAERLEFVKKKVASFLMVYQWERQQAEAERLTVDSGEVEADLRRFVRTETPHPGEFKHYLTYAHMSEADAMFIQRLTITGTKVLNAMLKRNDPHVLDAFTKKWVSQTSCKPGYVIPGCKQYTGSEPPP